MIGSGGPSGPAGDGDDTATGGQDASFGARDEPDVLSVCRWLPQPFPWGAFSSRSELVHVADRQAYVNLWLSQGPVHPGDFVGPPRGGIVPGPEPDYDVAMPLGGFLNIRAGVLRGWTESTGSEHLLRADGEVFRPEAYGPAWPYRLSDYRAMTPEDRLHSLAAVRRRRLTPEQSSAVVSPDAPPTPDRAHQAAAIAMWVSQSRPPRHCPCGEVPAARVSDARAGTVPGALLGHGGALATLVGTGTAEDAADVVRRLTLALTDPAQAGRMRAAEAAARRNAEALSGWRDGPLTEEAVALVAAQALRWHGMAVAPHLPFWVLGWIFVATPVMDGLLGQGSAAERARLRSALLDRADRARLERVLDTWTAAHQATRALQEWDDAAADTMVARASAVIDLRVDERPSPSAAPDAYTRTVESVIAELTAQ